MTEKHKFRRGASIAIALLIFLLCALAGVSALMMAASNAGRYSHKSEQEYYTVSSAALMIVDMLDDLQFTSKEVEYDYTRTWDYTNGKHEESDSYSLKLPDSTTTTSTMSGASTLRGSESSLTLCSKIQAHCEKLVPYLNVPNEWYESVKGKKGQPERPKDIEAFKPYTFTISVSGSGKSANVFKPVKCTLEMGSDYNLLFSFQVENTIKVEGEGEEEGSNLVTGEYAISLYWQAKVDFVQKTGEPKYTYAEKDSAGEFVSGSMLQHRTLQVTAKWRREDVVISRGEASSK